MDFWLLSAIVFWKENRLCEALKVNPEPRMTSDDTSLSLPRRLRYAAETLLAYAVYGFFWLLPLDAASAAGAALARTVGPLFGRSKVARRNLDLAFPEKTAAEKEAILRGMWDNIGRVIAEYPHLHRIWPRIEMQGAEHVSALAGHGKAALLFAGHLANWEIPAVCSKNLGIRNHLVYRKPNNPWVDGLLRHARDSGAAGHIEKGSSGAREILAALRGDLVVGMLVDQKLNEGIAVPFFGVEAMTAPAIAHFALKFKCPMIPCRVERLQGSRFRATVFPPLEVAAGADKEETVKRIMVEINAMIEGWIRERPEQWLWIHRRWPREVYKAPAQAAA
jgi:KDO2-lipid IV(A) lauroyltransferase